MKQPTHGGTRKGAGRKPSGKETVALAFRVPAEKAPELKPKIKAFIQKTLAE